jgi:hypothetical protein
MRTDSVTRGSHLVLFGECNISDDEMRVSSDREDRNADRLVYLIECGHLED